MQQTAVIGTCAALFLCCVIYIRKNWWKMPTKNATSGKLSMLCDIYRVSVQGVKSLGGHFACLCRGFEFYEVKKIFFFVIIFQKENWNTFTLLIIFIVKSLQKEQNSTNLLLWPPICRNKPEITPKWFNSLDTNSTSVPTLCPEKGFVIWYEM